MRKEFAVHMLNEKGKVAAISMAGMFADLLNRLENVCGAEGREMALVRTRLEEACFYAKKAMASRPENQLEAQP